MIIIYNKILNNNYGAKIREILTPQIINKSTNYILPPHLKRILIKYFALIEAKHITFRTFIVF